MFIIRSQTNKKIIAGLICFCLPFLIFIVGIISNSLHTIKFCFGLIISVPLPIISTAFFASIFFESKRKYAIIIDEKGVSFGFFSIEFFISWNEINKIQREERHYPIKKASLFSIYDLSKFSISVFEFDINHEAMIFKRKINLLDRLFNLIFPFITSNITIDVESLRVNENDFVNSIQKYKTII